MSKPAKSTKSKNPADWIAEYRTKYANTCTPSVMRNRVERAHQYLARTTLPVERRTVLGIMRGTCAVIYPGNVARKVATCSSSPRVSKA